MPARSKDQRLYDDLLNLKRHLRTCKDCMAALKTVDPYMMCRAGLLMTLRAAQGYDSVIRLRVAAHSHGNGHVFACPDLSKHGKPYSITAPALHVTAIQDGMF